jgi:hypothetical protein
MSTKRTFEVSHDTDRVVIEVDTSILTMEMAGHINTFLSNHERRLADQGGDLIATVARMFGALAIEGFAAEGGVDYCSDDDHFWTKKALLWAGEGWPDFDQLGIHIIDASVMTVTYSDVSISDITVRAQALKVEGGAS